MRTAVFTLLLATGAVNLAQGAERPQDRELAAYYAPVIYQETNSAVLDFITRFDYDGDWDGSNNWKHAYLYELPGYVYYAVIESTNHYFITYAFFHPRDYTAQPFEGFAPKTEHENDMEGATLTIEKDGTPFGKPILLETLAHDHFYSYGNSEYRRVQPGTSRLDGSIVFLERSSGGAAHQPAIYIEPEGHGVKAAGAEVLNAGYDFPGVVYRLTGRGAEVPASNRDPDGSYDLISIEDSLWLRRFDVGTTYCCGDNYSFPGGPPAPIGSSFNGPIGGCAAKPPWGWDQSNDAIVKGDWFRDPLKAYSTQFEIAGFAGTYLWNPYLLRDGQTIRNMCTESDVSKDVLTSIGASLLGIARAIAGGGESRAQARQNARQFFLSDTVLLEWSRNEDFERWNWDRTLSLVPTFRKDGLKEEMSIPLGGVFSLSSPLFKVATRYFDSIVMRYKCSVPAATATVFWTYLESPDFTDELSVSSPVCETLEWATRAIDLSTSPAWDKSKTIVKVKIEITTPDDVKIATVDPTAENPPNSEFVLNYLVFDRASFSDTFER